MKLPTLTAALFLLLGTDLPVRSAREGQDEHPQAGQTRTAAGAAHNGERKLSPQDAKRHQDAKPTQRQAKTPQQQPQGKVESHSQATDVKPTPQPRTQQAAHPQQQPANPSDRAHQGDAEKSQARAQQSRPTSGNGGPSEHGRISNAHYAASFGSGHRFHVNQGDYSHRRFQYGGYSFGFVDPWPISWGYSDDVYVVYTDGGYYMYDHVHPGFAYFHQHPSVAVCV